jgi:hypothetical protein
MAIRIPYGIDPDEVWDLDFCAEVTRGKASMERETARSLRETAAELPDADRRAALLASADLAEARATSTDADLKAYTPGSGPVFQVGAIPGKRRAELLGRHQEASGMPDVATRLVAMAEWAREVVAATVKGHRNLRTASGRELAFDSHDGRPSDRTIEAYAPILADLAWVILFQQRIQADAKNA